MKTRYGKSLLDAAPEAERMLRENSLILERQKAGRAAQIEPKPRRSCAVCGSPVEQGAGFTHRGGEFAQCGICGHINSMLIRPAPPFAEIYPEMTREQFSDRTRRVFLPKLDWALERLAESGMDPAQLLKEPWLELGCGAGHFLQALQVRGAEKPHGLEADPELAARGRAFLGESLIDHYHGDLARALELRPSRVYAAWFVLEHIENPGAFFRALGKRPLGTVFLFAVPTWGLATILENRFGHLAARSLDGLVHSQLFTDDSIAYCLELGGLKPIGQWVFGSDALDLRRLLKLGPGPDDAGNPLFRLLESMDWSFWDQMQRLIDSHRLSDNRHLAAVRA